MRSRMHCLVTAATLACGAPSHPQGTNPVEGRAATSDDEDDDDAEEDDDDDGETPVALSDLPDAVIRAIEAVYPGAELLTAEMDAGVYDVDFLSSGGACMEAEVQPDGSIVGFEAEDAHECARE